MKNTIERTLFQQLLIGCTVIIFLFLGISCEKDDGENGITTQIVGTWHQTSRTIDKVSAPKDSTRLLMQINENNICILCDSSAVAVKTKKIVKRSGWDYSGNLLNIAIDLPASWTPAVEANSLTLERVDFNQDGKLIKTMLTFERVADMEIK